MEKGKIYNLPSESILLVIADGGIAHPAIIGNPMVPVVIVDSRKRPDLEELIKLHRNFSDGDVTSQWGRRVEGAILIKKTNVFLHLDFLRPVALSVTIEFEIDERPTLIDMVVRQKCMYLQSGRPGASVSNNIDDPKIFVEINAAGFDEKWNDLFVQTISKRIRASGKTRLEAKKEARTYIGWVRRVMQRRPERQNRGDFS